MDGGRFETHGMNKVLIYTSIYSSINPSSGGGGMAFVTFKDWLETCVGPTGVDGKSTGTDQESGACVSYRTERHKSKGLFCTDLVAETRRPGWKLVSASWFSRNCRPHVILSGDKLANGGTRLGARLGARLARSQRPALAARGGFVQLLCGFIPPRLRRDY